MRKISFVSANKSAWGGSEYLWFYTALKFCDSGYEVSASIPRWKEIPAAIKEFESKGVKVYFNTDISNYKKLYNRFVPSSMQLNYLEDGFKFLLDLNPDLVVINQGGNTGGIDLMEFCIKKNLKFVTISQAANEAKWPSDNLNKRLSESLPKAIMNYFVSRANIHLTEVQIGQEIKNAKLIYNPFNIENVNEFEYPEVRENFMIANVARHEFYAKGQDILFEVLNERKWRQRNLIVNLYGKGEHTYGIHKLKNYFQLDKVNIEGYKSPNEIWKKNHALILTSRYEGLPLALVEAMLCARLGIVTAVSGNAEIIIDGENGFLAKCPNSEFVDEALERAWSRNSEWELLGKNAKEYVKSKIPSDPVEYFFNELVSLKA